MQFGSQQQSAIASANQYQMAQAQGMDPSAPQTEMSIQVQLAREANSRLVNVHHELLRLIGRLYGEGAGSVESDPKAAPKPAGVMSEMHEALGWIDGVAERLEYAAKRLSQLA